MKLNLNPYKGMRDFYPEDQKIFNYIFDNLKEVVRSFGYKQYNAPMIESEELYLSKSSQEIVNEQTYSFLDRGNRKVVIRPEMTPSVARMVAAKRKSLNYPLRWYSVPNLLRYERPQNGRFREHWQLNVDIFGEDSVLAEIELLEVIYNIFKKFKASINDYTIRINSRILIENILDDLGVSKDNYLDVFRIIDKKNKIDSKSFKEELAKFIKNSKDIDNLLQFLAINSLDQIPTKYKEGPSYKNLNKIFTYLKLPNLVFDTSIIRGFDYYTDIVFEVTDNDPNNNRSIMGGGRYDHLIEQLEEDKLPIVGFGLGDSSFLNFLRAHNLIPELKNHQTLGVLLIGDVYGGCFDLLNQLRDNNIDTVINFSNTKIGQKIKWALREDLRYAIIVGENELKMNKYNLKDLTNSTQQELTIEEIIKTINK